MLKKLLLIGLLVFPSSVSASISFSEVAWMGSSSSANDEWIELYNDGSTVSVDGWVVSDGMNLEIVLSGSIAAGQYAVLERTDDTSSPASAFLVYTGALSNAGATLTLYDDHGAIVDQLAGGENWEDIGGDNTTKETAQYTTGGWVTADPTPGRKNVSTGTMPAAAAGDSVDEEKETKQSVANQAKEEDSPSSLFLIPRELSVTITVPKEVYVNQAVQFTSTADGVSKGILQSLQYEWNFGDFITSSTPEPTHRYQHPGNYVVTLRVTYKDYEATFRKSLVVLPVALELSKDSAGDLLVHNNARYEIDVSGYRLGAMTFPERSIMLAGSTVVVSMQQIGRATTVVDQMQQVVATLGDTAVKSRPQAAAPVAAQITAAPLIKPEERAAENDELTNFSFAESASTDEVAQAPTATDTSAMTAPVFTSSATDTSTGSAAPAPATDNRLYYALLALIGISLFGVYARQA